ncbi:hypothetical protein ETR14_17705 [Sphingosinicella sp. BN140058]|nr:hypothetical protein ETR14_17705 [Sphingosinicella sp. BN140058]
MTITTEKVYPLSFDAEIAQLGFTPSPSTETIIVSQIEIPETTSERAWNAYMARSASEALRMAYKGVTDGTATPQREVSVEASARVIAVAPGIIAAELSSTTFLHANPKSWDSQHAFLWSVSEMRPLTADDLFDPATSWWTKLVPAVLRAAYGEPVTETIADYESLERSQTPRLLREGMCLKFHEDANGAHVLWQPQFIPWRELRRYVRKNLLFDLEQVEVSGTGWENCSEHG